MKKSYEMPKLEEIKLGDVDIMAASNPLSGLTFKITGTFEDWFNPTAE